MGMLKDIVQNIIDKRAMIGADDLFSDICASLASDDIDLYSFPNFYKETRYYDNKEDMSCINTGDILFVRRGVFALPHYYHFAIYLGNDRVIHYKNGVIYEANFNDFLKALIITNNKFYQLKFNDESYLKYDEINDYYIYKKYHLYSPKVTIERAKSRIGETNYNVLSNNCESFAIWCKTGFNMSVQVINGIVGFDSGFMLEDEIDEFFDKGFDLIDKIQY